MLNNNYRHGHGGNGEQSPTYKSWHSMKQRCLNPNNPSAHNYSERGITVCDRWLDFNNFLADMGERPENTSLDRIDNDKGYSKENCRWTDHTTQIRNSIISKLDLNKAVNIIQRHENGESQVEIAAFYKVDPSTVRAVITGKTWKEARQIVESQRA